MRFLRFMALSMLFCSGLSAETPPGKVKVVPGGATPSAEPVANPSPAIEPQPSAPVGAALPAPQSGPLPEGGGNLDLLCFGGGSANRPTVGTINAWNSDGDSANATIVGQRSQGFGDQVSLHMQGQDGRFRMPRTMLPPIHGGDDGWFKLHNIKYAPNEITASVAVNVLNNPKLRLDRYTGTISVSGKAGNYTGQCQRYDPSQMQRQF